VLPSAHRLREPALFQDAVRRGRRAGARTVTVHWRAADPSSAPDPVRVGLVVNRAVGNAVTRNLVKRRLRHLSREHLASLPSSGVLVVRALPAAATAPVSELGADLDRCLQRVTGG
jgi:ribonuclease P protein component